MPVFWHENTKQFHLLNPHLSYIIQVLENGHLGQLYVGKRLNDREDFGQLQERASRSFSAYPENLDPYFSLEQLRQEHPCYGSGDMRYPAVEVEGENGSTLTDFVYLSHKIFDGKPRLEGLPATYTEQQGEATTLQILLRDPLTGLELTLNYTIFETLPVLARSAYFHNGGSQCLVLQNAMSLSVDLPDKEYEMLTLYGAWAKERMVQITPLQMGAQEVYSLRGGSSHHMNPFLALKRPDANETQGEVLGFSLVYSGNFLAQAQVDGFDVVRVMLGIHPEHFSWELLPGAHFQTPEAVMVYSDTGLGGMSRAFHTLYRTRLARGYWRDRPRPVLINNWEATYFHFNEEKILEIAKGAKELGIELFVLDDGWFGKRDDDTTSLGDWYPDLSKLPGGIVSLAKKIEDLGMKFGLWFEPEMVSKDSRLYREHPDWALSIPGRGMSPSRHQHVLDFSRPEVVDYIGDLMEKVLSQAPVSYVKWDMNRSMTEVYSRALPAHRQGEVFHRYILGVYALYQRLTDRFPQILFESCSGGGGRFDPGLLYYAPHCWTSDNTDGVERLKIQYGTSMVYPVSSMGAHVSAVPNHQVHRMTPLSTRANVAFFGAFGYELDLNLLSQQERQQVKEQVAFMKEYRQLLQFGDFYRLKNPFTGNEAGWMAVSADRRQAVVGYYRVLRHSNMPFTRMKLQGLDPSLCYRVTVEGESSLHYGDELMYAGLSTSDRAASKRDGRESGDFYSFLAVVKAE